MQRCLEVWRLPAIGMPVGRPRASPVMGLAEPCTDEGLNMHPLACLQQPANFWRK